VAAGIVMRRLLLKAASRLRRARYRARSMTISIRLQNEARTRFEAGLRFAPVTDSHSLMQHLLVLWQRVLEQAGVGSEGSATDGDGVLIRKAAVTLHDLESLDLPEQLELSFGEATVDAGKLRQRERLAKVMDDINRQFGRDAVALGFAPDQVKTFSGTKIAFSRIPEREEFHE
jgi:DNA polymerase-4